MSPKTGFIGSLGSLRYFFFVPKNPWETLNSGRNRASNFKIGRAPGRLNITSTISPLIIKITISSIVIGLKNSYFSLIHPPTCYRTVQEANHIQSSSLNQPITFKVVVVTRASLRVQACVHARLLLCFCRLTASGKHDGLRMFTSPFSVFLT